MNTVSPAYRPAYPRGADVAYVIDPRFAGGTSAAMAQELRAVAKLIRPRIYAISSAMFKGKKIAPVLDQVLQEQHLTPQWDPVSISADIVILHNPSFLKHQTVLETRILARRFFVVSHENFSRPGGAVAFDVDACLGQIDRVVLALEKFIAPISPINRLTVSQWSQQSASADSWSIAPLDWFNICQFDLRPPVARPQDRRGRLSRPGIEKFPDMADLDRCFPKSAQSNILLGADCLAQHAQSHRHWRIVPFQGMEVDRFFDEIDFMVHFTSPRWRESFGRVLAEAIAAGKVVISDAKTASSFGGAVIASTPQQVDGVIAKFIAQPALYHRQVRAAQKAMQKFSARAFREFFQTQVLEDKMLKKQGNR